MNDALRGWLLPCCLSLICFLANAQTELYESLKDQIDILVAQDGSGDYTSVQAAIDAAPSNSNKVTVIFVRNGKYYEKIIVPNEKPNLTIVGEDVDATVLWYDDRSISTIELNTFTSHSVRVDASDVKFINLTISNPATESQAVALHGNGDRQTFAHCRILGWQDTYYSDMRSRNYFKDCFIEGKTDYIFGFGVTLFDSCQIHTIGTGGYVTASSTPENYQFGHVFRNSVIANPGGVSSFSLGRPWFDYARTVFLECYESEAIKAAGWDRWNGREKACFYREYKCFGPGSDFSGRIDFGKQLTDAEAAEYTIENIFAADNFPAGDDDYLVYWETRFKGHASEPYLEDIIFRADGDWPVKPTEDWVPDIDTDPVYTAVKSLVPAFLDSVNHEFGDFDLYVGGEKLEGFDPDKTVYGVELPDGATEALEVTVQGKAFVRVTYPDEVPGYTDFIISPYSQIGGKEYQLYNSIDSVFWDAELTSLTLDHREIYQEGVYSYDTIMEGGEDAPFIRWTRSNPDASHAIVRISKTPGTAVLTITAPDGETTRDFLVNYVEPLGTEEDLNDEHIRIYENPNKSGTLRLEILDKTKGQVNFELFGLNGGSVHVFEAHQASQGEIIALSTEEFGAGFYFLKVSYNDRNFVKRIVIE